MSNPIRYQTFAVTAATGTEVTTRAITTVSGTKQAVLQIATDRTANVTILVYAGQTLVMEMDSQHFPSDGEFVDLPLDVDAAGFVDVGISNSSGGNVTQQITLKYNYGT